MSFGLCAHCAMEVEYLQDEHLAVVLCPDLECPYNQEGHYILREYEDTALPEWVLATHGLPPTLAIKPGMRYRHTKLIFWLNNIRESVYLWYSEEVLSMVYAQQPRLKDERYRFSLTPSAKRLMDLDLEELFLGKQIIPDLVRIVTTLNYYYKICGYAARSK